MQEWKNVEIGILRPPNIAHTRLLRDFIDQSTDRSTAERNQHMDSRIEELRSMFEEAAEKIGVRFSVTEYQLFENERGVATVTGKRARCVKANDILVTYDPSPTAYNFVTRSRIHPLQRALVAFSDRDELMEVASLLGVQKVPLISSKQEECVQRIFALHLPLNDDAASMQHAHNLSVVMNAMRYPYLDSQVYTDNPDAIKLIDEHNPLSQPEGRRHICESLSHSDEEGGKTDRL